MYKVAKWLLAPKIESENQVQISAEAVCVYLVLMALGMVCIHNFTLYSITKYLDEKCLITDTH